MEPRLNRLTRNGESFQIELKMMDVLVCLAEHAGELVERQELIDTVWATEFISENILTRAIAELRRTLGDDAKEPTYIETIHRRGYRLIAPVEPVAATVHPFPTPTPRAAEERSPYPGLAAFTEDDAEFFFGREAEVAQLWRKLTTRRLLAIIGPSGVGKSSTAAGGSDPGGTRMAGAWSCCSPATHRTPRWPARWRQSSVTTPTRSPNSSTSATTTPRSRSSPAGGGFTTTCCWSSTSSRSCSPRTRTRSRAFTIVARGGLRIRPTSTSCSRMRDDFLITCNEHERSVADLFRHHPDQHPGAQRSSQGHHQPGRSLGYTFEDEGLVDEMLDAVEGEQGALPLLAFTVARLWEERDRERTLMTREMYERDRRCPRFARPPRRKHPCSHRRQPTADRSRDSSATSSPPRARGRSRDGTTCCRCSRIRDESPAEVLRSLTDARLLNDVRGHRRRGGSRTRPVEIVHESLLDGVAAPRPLADPGRRRRPAA